MKRILSLTVLFLLSLPAFSQYPTFRIDYKFVVDEALLQKNNNQIDSSQVDLIKSASLLLAFQDGDKPIAQVWVNRKYVRAKTSIYGDNYEINNKEAEETFMVYPESKEYYKTEEFSDKLLDFGDSTKLVSELPIKFVDGEEKTIAGYTCKLAKIIAFENDEQIVTIDVWYSEYLPAAYWGEYVYLKNIPGAALEISTSGIGIQASTISPEGDVDIFTIPHDYTQIESPQDFRQAYGFYGGDTVDSETEKLKEYQLNESLTAFLDEDLDLYGIKNSNGDILVIPQYKDIYQYDNGISIVSDGNYRYGALDTTGKIVIPIKYEILTYNNLDSTFIFYENGKGGMIDIHHKIIIPNDYEYISHLTDGKSIVAQNNLYGIIDKESTTIVPLKYTHISEVTGDRFISYSSELTCILYSFDGKKIAEYDFISNADADNLFVVMQNNKYGYINSNGKITIPLIYDYASSFFEGRATVVSEGASDYIYINTKGEIIP